jgi:hypothetical protein
VKRALRWGARAAVLLWLAAGLVASVTQPAQAPPEAVVAARVRPLPEQPPPPRPEPPAPQPQQPAPEPAQPAAAPAEAAPEPAAAPAEAAPEPAAVGAAELAHGSQLLDGEGAFPVLSLGYEDFPSFRAYARAMQELGARFVVVREREIVGSVDVESGAVGEAGAGRGFSPRARDYSGEPGLAPVARSARQRFGRGAVVMMLVPRALDAALFGGIARELERRGEPRAGLREIRGRYARAPGGGVWLRIDTAVRRDGSELALGTLFDVTRIAGAARS